MSFGLPCGKFPHQNHKSLTSRLATVILTLPTSSRRLRLFSLFFNSLLLLSSVEFVIEDYLYDAPEVVFTRLGAIYPDKAKLAIRYPHHQDPIHVVWRRVRESFDMQAQSWTLGPPVMLSEVGDWVNSTTISPLWPNTIYECKSSGHSVASMFLTLVQIRWRPRINNFYPTHEFLSSSRPFRIPDSLNPPHSASS